MLQNNLFCTVLRDAQRTKTAVAAINVLNDLTARAVVKAAEKAFRPVILQPSTGTVRRYGVEAFARLVENVRAAATVPVVLHLDHCTVDTLARECVRAGWNSVMMDYSALSYEENVARTRRMADYAHIYGVAVEGEIGVIQGVEENVSHDTASLASYEETVNYLETTGIDAVAPAIGTAHGVYAKHPELNFTLVERLRSQCVPIVIHGGTGLPTQDFERLIACGAAKINISTALKQAYLGAARSALKQDGITPLGFDEAVEISCCARMEAFIRLFANEKVDVYADELSC